MKISILVGVGKSSLLLQYTTGEFRKEYTVTIGLEFGSKQLTLDPETNVTLQVWDTVPLLIVIVRRGRRPSNRSSDPSIAMLLLSLSCTASISI